MLDGKPVSQPAFGDDVAEMRAIGFYLPAQAMNVHAQGVLEHLFQGPQATPKKVGGHGSTCTAHEDVEDLGFGRREGQMDPWNRRFMTSSISCCLEVV